MELNHIINGIVLGILIIYGILVLIDSFRTNDEDIVDKEHLIMAVAVGMLIITVMDIIFYERLGVILGDLAMLLLSVSLVTFLFTTEQDL